MLIPKATLPRLENGDRLTREEFHRRYRELPDPAKAELIDGIVYVEQRVRFAEHAEPHAFGVTWLGFHTVRAADVEAAARSTVLLSETSEVQPDACLVRFEAGGPRLTPDGYLEGPPQLVLEVAERAADYDLGAKLELYRRTGVPEYVIWRTLDGAIDRLRLSGDRYERLAPDERGGIQSEVSPACG